MAATAADVDAYFAELSAEADADYAKMSPEDRAIVDAFAASLDAASLDDIGTLFRRLS